MARHLTLLVSAALAMAVVLTAGDALANAPKKGAPTAQVLAKESAPARSKPKPKPKSTAGSRVPMKKAKAKVAPKPSAPKPASTPAPAAQAPRAGRA